MTIFMILSQQKTLGQVVGNQVGYSVRTEST